MDICHDSTSALVLASGDDATKCQRSWPRSTPPSSGRSNKHKQKLSKFRYVTKADKRKVANGPQYAAKIFVFNEGVQSESTTKLPHRRYPG